MNKNYFFISKPRCASTHIYEGLTEWNDKVDGWKPHYHITASQMKERFPNKYKNSFSFGVIRHPCDLVRSWYNEHKKERYGASINRHYSIPIGEWINKGCPTHWGDFSFNPLHQYKWLYDNQEKQIVSYIMRLEEYNKDIEIVYKKIKKYLSNSVTLETIKKTRKNETINEVGLSNEQKDKVYQLFKKDFEVFGYNSI